MQVGPTSVPGHFFAYIYPSSAQEFAAAVCSAVAMALPTVAALQSACAALRASHAEVQP